MPIKMFYLTVDGQWSDWTNWGDCSVTCGGGKRKRNRTCTSPPPQNGGQKCPGPSEEEEACNEQPCPGRCFHRFRFQGNYKPTPPLS